MPQPERRLALIDADAEQFPFELGLQVPKISWRGGPDAEAGLADAGECAAILAELIFERGQARDPHRVEPVWIDRGEVLADVEHHEAIDFEARLGLFWILRGRTRRVPAAAGILLRKRQRRGPQRQACNQPARAGVSLHQWRSHRHLSFSHGGGTSSAFADATADRRSLGGGWSDAPGIQT